MAASWICSTAKPPSWASEDLMDQAVGSILARADSGARILVIAAAATMISVVSAQVVMRYAFNGSFDWADEVSRLAFVWTIFLAIPLGIRDGTHVGIELLVARFPPAVRGMVFKAMSLIAGIMMLIVFWQGVIVAGVTWSERLASIDVTSSVFFMPVILGALHSALHLLHLGLGSEPVV